MARPLQSGPETATPAGWRQWRAPALLVIMILLGGVVIALLQVGPPVSGPLDPSDTGPLGVHALAALLTSRGQHVIRADNVPSATRAAGADVTLVVTSPQLLSHGQLAALAAARANLLLVAPGEVALAALAPKVALAGRAPVRGIPPACGLPGARLAGAADMGGLVLRAVAAGTWRCYPAHPLPRGARPGTASTSGATAGSGGTGNAGRGRDGTRSGDTGPAALVRYASGGRTITVLATGFPLSNANLAREGNAALAMNLLSDSPRIVWLVPGPVAGAATGIHGVRPLTRLIPLPVYLVVIELGVAVLLTALWRMRRFGPLVAEPLPATVRASETVEGHGRLYRSQRARERAAAALRAATLARITTRLGLPQTVPHDVTCQELASRTGRDAAEIRAVLFERVPPDDTALVALAAGLDSLERQVLAP